MKNETEATGNDFPPTNADEARREAIVQSSRMVSILGAALKHDCDNLNEQWLQNTGDLLVSLGRHIGSEMREEIIQYYERTELAGEDK